MYIMVQTCSYLKTLEVFFAEPTKIHFIKEISKKIGIAPTSIRNNIAQLNKDELIIPQESKPFNGYVANRDNEKFVFLKRVYNLYSLRKLKEYLEKNLFPKLAVVFGSYSIGEDIEDSDIDIYSNKANSSILLSDFLNETKHLGIKRNETEKTYIEFLNLKLSF